MNIENLPTLEENTKSDVYLKEKPEDFQVGDIVFLQGKKRKVLALQPLETTTDLEYVPILEKKEKEHAEKTVEQILEDGNKKLRDTHFFSVIDIISLEKLSKEQLVSIAKLLAVDHKEDMKNNELIEIINGSRPV